MFFSSLFISIYVARILGPEAKGMYYLLIQMVSIVVLFGMFGIDNSAIYFLGRQKMPQAELYSHILFLTIVSSAAFFIFIMASHSFLLKSVLRGVPGSYLRMMTLAIPLLMLNQASLSIILGLNRIMLYNVLEMICYGLLFINFVIFAVGLGMGIYGAYLGFVVTYLFMDCVYIILFIRKIGLNVRWERLKDILHYGLRSFLGPLSLLLIYKVDSFVLNFFSDIRQVGFYSIAVSFAELLPFIPIAVGTVLFPKLASQEQDTLNASMARVVRVIFSFLILLALTFLFAGKWLILFMYGKIYSPSIVPMYILLPGFVFISLYYLFFSYFGAVGKPEIVTAILIVTLLIKLFLSIFAIARWGMFGAASASAISYFFCGLSLLIAYRFMSKQLLRDIFVMKGTDLKYVWNIFTSTWTSDKADKQIVTFPKIEGA